jgi:hypothetical protein
VLLDLRLLGLWGSIPLAFAPPSTPRLIYLSPTDSGPLGHDEYFDAAHTVPSASLAHRVKPMEAIDSFTSRRSNIARGVAVGTDFGTLVGYF